jgi:TetR/AcrR family transcriptional regulator
MPINKPQRFLPADAVSAEERILSAATEEFSENGFYGARTQAIADAAGVNKAMLHYYFRSKENLYARVIQAAFKKTMTRVGQSWLGPGPLKARAEMVVDSYMESYEENPALLKIILREVVDGGKRLKKSVQKLKKAEIPREGHTPLQMVQEAARELGLPPGEMIHFLVNLIGMCVVSFTSPILLETILDVDVSDMKGFLRDRRKAIKATVFSSLDTLKKRKKGTDRS